MDISKQRATGRINVTSYNAQPQDDGGIFTVADVQVTEEFFGDLAGAGSARFISAKEIADGATHFAGIEKFLGKLGDRSGSFLMRNSGAVTGNVLLRWNYRRDSDLYIIYTAGQRFASLETNAPQYYQNSLTVKLTYSWRP